MSNYGTMAELQDWVLGRQGLRDTLILRKGVI